MRVAKVRLDFDFTTKLMLNMSLLKLGLKKHLQSDNEFGPLFPGQVDIAKFAFTQRPSNFEVT